MPRFMPTERHAVCSALGRLAMTGPTSHAAANSSAVLPRITARYSSSVVAVFFAAASCITSPSAMVAAAEERMSSARSEPTSTIIRNAWPSRKSPTRTLASLPQSMRADNFPRRNSLSSTTSSCSKVAVCMNSTEAASLICPSPEYPLRPAIASVSIGRRRLPPDEIRWLATSGIMVTSDPVRDRIVALTRSMSAATSPTSASIEAFDGLSKGTITDTRVSNFGQVALCLFYNRKCRLWLQGQVAVDRPGDVAAPGLKGARRLRELVRTNDIVLVSAVGALLDGANIHHLVLDQNMSVIEGSLGILPRRILVHEDDNREARQLLAEAGLAHELRPDD